MARLTKTSRISTPPEGFVYQEDFVSSEAEAFLVDAIRKLPLREFEFRGYLGKRRVISFGFHYDFGEGRLNPAGDMPEFLFALQDKAAVFAGLRCGDLPHALVTEYTPGTPIGWHSDRPVFDQIIGISLLSACQFRLRRRAPDGWERYTHQLAPRSAYMLDGNVRNLWQHSIPPVEDLRYSVTFRSLHKISISSI
jgi:alkylated DNA repair dioxygenase AlkB